MRKLLVKMLRCESNTEADGVSLRLNKDGEHKPWHCDFSTIIVQNSITIYHE